LAVVVANAHRTVGMPPIARLQYKRASPLVKVAVLKKAKF